VISSGVRRTGRGLGYGAIGAIAAALSTVALGASAADSPTAQNVQLITVLSTIDPAPDGASGPAPTTCDLLVKATVPGSSQVPLGPAAPSCPADAGLSDAVGYTLSYDSAGRANVVVGLPSKFAPFGAAQGPSGQGWILQAPTCQGTQVASYGGGGCGSHAVRVDASLHVPDGFIRARGPQVSARHPKYVVTFTDSTFNAAGPSPCSDVVTMETLTVTFPACGLSDPGASVTSVPIGIPDLGGLVPPAGHPDGFSVSVTTTDPDGIITGRCIAPAVGAATTTGVLATTGNYTCSLLHVHSSNGLPGTAAGTP
jgi:hypothetical protein